MSRTERRAAVLIALGAAAVVASGFLPWFRLRRTYSGYTLARLVVALGDYELGVPAWLGVAWYVLPAVAALAWVLLFHGGRVGVRRRGHLGCGAALLALSAGYVAAAAHYASVEAGEVVALVGSAAVLAGAAAGKASR